jgi:flagellar hook protein FlgE
LVKDFYGKEEPMITAVGNNLSALKAIGKKMGVTANNVANSESEGFKKSRAVMKEGVNNDVEVEIERVDVPGPIVHEMVNGEVTERELSNVDLTEEIPATIQIQRSYEANLKAIETQEDMLGSILDIFG